jgi:hypothetical protein
MRDLDELLDPVVSRRASEAAGAPDFAAVARRGRQRRRRAQTMAIGAVVAVVAAVSVVGTQVVEDRAAPGPAVPPGYDDPNGELQRAVEAGEAEVDSTAVGVDGATLTVWSRLVRLENGLAADRFGFSLTSGG